MYVHGTSKRHGCRINQAVFLFFQIPHLSALSEGGVSVSLADPLSQTGQQQQLDTHPHTHIHPHTHPDCSWKDAPTRYFTFLYLFLSLFSVSPPLTSAGRGSEFIAVFTALFCLLAQGQWCYSTIQ